MEPSETGRVQKSTRFLARPGIIRAQRFRAQGFGALAAHHTIANLLALEAPFDLVRLIYANDRTDAAWTLDGAILAASARVNDGVNPVDAAG